MDSTYLGSAATSTPPAYTTSIRSPPVTAAYLDTHTLHRLHSKPLVPVVKRCLDNQYPSNYLDNVNSPLRAESSPLSNRARCPSYSALVHCLTVAFSEQQRRLWSQRNPAASTACRAVTLLAVYLPLTKTVGSYIWPGELELSPSPRPGTLGVLLSFVHMYFY